MHSHPPVRTFDANVLIDTSQGLISPSILPQDIQLTLSYPKLHLHQIMGRPRNKKAATTDEICALPFLPGAITNSGSLLLAARPLLFTAVAS